MSRDFSQLGELSVVGQPAGHAGPSAVMYPGGPDLDRALPGPGEPIPENAGPGGRRPEWLKVRLGAGETYAGLRRLLRDEALHTVCEEARCPNQGECWTLGTATFMVLGSVCTRNCGFCAIETGRPPETDLDEPRRVAEAARRMGLRHAVITMVARDDLMTWEIGAHGSTYGGNPLSCAAALATIDLIEDGLIENAERVGSFLLDGLRDMQVRRPLIKEVRGLGLMIGIEFQDHDTMIAVEQAAFRRGLLVLGAGDDVVRMCPPLVFRRDQAETALEVFEEAVAEAGGS